MNFNLSDLIHKAKKQSAQGRQGEKMKKGGDGDLEKQGMSLAQ